MEAVSNLKNGSIRAFFTLSSKIFVTLSMGYGEILWSDLIPSKGTQVSPNPQWTQISAQVSNIGMSGKGSMYVCDNAGTTYIVLVGDREGKAYVSQHAGVSFDRILTSKDILAAHPSSQEIWYRDGDGFGVLGIAGYGNEVFVSIGSARQHDYAVLRGEITGSTMR